MDKSFINYLNDLNTSVINKVTREKTLTTRFSVRLAEVDITALPADQAKVIEHLRKQIVQSQNQIFARENLLRAISDKLQQFRPCPP